MTFELVRDIAIVHLGLVLLYEEVFHFCLQVAKRVDLIRRLDAVFLHTLDRVVEQFFLVGSLSLRKSIIVRFKQKHSVTNQTKVHIE